MGLKNGWMLKGRVYQLIFCLYMVSPALRSLSASVFILHWKQSYDQFYAHKISQKVYNCKHFKHINVAITLDFGLKKKKKKKLQTLL